MKKLKGLSASGGVAAGKVCIYSQNVYDSIPQYGISERQVDNELERAEAAFRTAENSIKQMRDVSRSLFGEQGDEIIKAHITILNDPGLRKKVREEIIQSRVNAEHAVYEIFSGYVKRLADKGTHFEEITHDIYDIRDRLIEAFGISGGSFLCPAVEKQPVIIAAVRLTPSLILSTPPENALAYITHKGGYTSHATILARTRNIPVVFGIDVENELSCRCSAIVDGSAGEVYVDPDEETISRFAPEILAARERNALCPVRSTGETRTLDGRRVLLKVNISAQSELEALKRSSEEGCGSGYDGIGLLRTEFLFMSGIMPPAEDEQYKVYSEIIGSAGPIPPVIRLLDISSDKMPPFLSIPPDVDPNFDLRGTRAVTTFRGLYLTQARALLRAAANGNLRILFPMVADQAGYDIFTELISEARESLRREGTAYGPVETGLMFETPASAMLAEELLEKADFSNIGTNDLLQYTLAASRESVISQKLYHLMHPAVLKLVKLVVDAGAKLNKETCLCGEIAGIAEYYPVLLDIGVRSFSVAPAAYESVKSAIRGFDSASREGVFKEYVTAYGPAAQDDFLNELQRKQTD